LPISVERIAAAVPGLEPIGGRDRIAVAALVRALLEAAAAAHDHPRVVVAHDHDRFGRLRPQQVVPGRAADVLLLRIPAALAEGAEELLERLGAADVHRHLEEARAVAAARISRERRRDADLIAPLVADRRLAAPAQAE